jgi:crotonobetainyl-CoA:carnitine CoA-transferase CaiB-like acyl-CoA transferase
MGENSGGLLSPYRILDLCDEKGIVWGRILGDLGADVIKVERPSRALMVWVSPYRRRAHDTL